MPTVDSVPSIFSTNQIVTFAIPAGFWASAQWVVVGSPMVTVSTPYHVTVATPTPTFGHTVNFKSQSGSGPYSDTVSATSQQLADINSAAGGNLTANITFLEEPPGPEGPEDSMTVTSLMLILSPMGGGSGGGSGGGGKMGTGRAILNPQDVIWNVGYLFGTTGVAPGGDKNLVDSVPFAQLQDFTFKDALSFKELPGNTSLGAIGVGASDRKVTGDCKMAVFRQRQLQQFRGATPQLFASITSPSVAPTLTAATGTTTFTTGYLAVGYTYMNAVGETVISPLQTVQITVADQQVTVTALSTPPAGVAFVNWYMSAQIYATALLASAGPVYRYLQNTAGQGHTIIAFPTGTVVPPTVSTVAVAKSLFSSNQLDEPTLFHMHLMSPVGISAPAIEIRLYNCCCPDYDMGLKLRDFVIPNATFNCYGDPNSGTWYDIISPGDHTQN